MKQAIIRLPRSTNPSDNWFVQGQANTPEQHQAQREHQKKQDMLQKKDPSK